MCPGSHCAGHLRVCHSLNTPGEFNPYVLQVGILAINVVCPDFHTKTMNYWICFAVEHTILKTFFTAKGIPFCLVPVEHVGLHMSRKYEASGLLQGCLLVSISFCLPCLGVALALIMFLIAKLPWSNIAMGNEFWERLHSM